MSNFMEMLQRLWARGLFVCVGLDSEIEKIPGTEKFTEGELPASYVFDFNKRRIMDTTDTVCAYKPNIAFYEDRVESGIEVLEQTIHYIKSQYPEIPVILDAKRGDIGNTNNGYVKSAFNYYGADAITINPYLGAEANKPFLDCKDKGIIVLCRTSNPGAGEFQDRQTYVSWDELQSLISEDIATTMNVCKWLRVEQSAETRQDAIGGVLMPLYHYVALNVYRKWNTNENCAIVAGATYPEELAMLRFLTHDLPFLIPGIGAQGGDVEKTVKAGLNSNKTGIIINSSRGIIFADDPRREAINLNELINSFR